MATPTRRARRSFARLAAGLGDATYDLVAQADGYRVTDVSPGDVDFTEQDWDGDDAVSNLPEDDGDVLQRAFLLVPDSEDERENVTSYKLPFREVSQDGSLGPANVSGLQAAMAAINGARGGVEGVGQDVLEGAFDLAARMRAEADDIDDADEAPEFEPANASADPSDVVAEATASSDGDTVTDVNVVAAADDADPSLAGIIWGAGDHDLAIGGDPTPVRVPEGTVPATFEALKQDVTSGDVTLGFDHPPKDSVAEKTGIVDIGTADGVALSSDERHIVLTDSTLTNDRAAEAAQSGDFDDLDWSIVADVAIRRGEGGDPVVKDGRVVLDAIRIKRIDAVETGAVDAASIERDSGALPDLKDNVQAVQQQVDVPNSDTDAAVEALRASATAIDDTMNDPNIDPSDVDDLDDARDQLSAAASIIDDMEDELDAAEAKATSFEALLDAHDVDPEDFDDPDAAAQAVIDEQTEDIRRDIAELEADLASHDVDDADDRAEALAGKSPSELEAALNARKAEAFDRDQKAQSKGRAVARGDDTGSASLSGGGGNDGEADEIALGAMDAQDRIQAEAADLSPADYVQQEYDLNAGEYSASDELHDDIIDQLQEADA